MIWMILFFAVYGINILSLIIALKKEEYKKAGVWVAILFSPIIILLCIGMYIRDMRRGVSWDSGEGDGVPFIK